MAISRPIEDSFVILYPHDSLNSARIGFQPFGKIDRFGPAVIPNLPSYYTTRIRVTEAEIPSGIFLQTQAFRVEPTFSSGTAIQLGSDVNQVITGTLVDEQGPIGYLSGVLRSIDDDEAPSVRLFTNKSGKFYVWGLKAGRYELQTIDRKRTAIILTVEDKSGAIQALGDITMQEKRAQ